MDLQKRFEEITGLNDFTLKVLDEFNEDNFGMYYIESKVIEVYSETATGERYDYDIIEVEALHELAHHLQYHYVKGYKKTQRTVHGYVFKRQFAKLLKKYYNGKVPKNIVQRQVERGYISDKEFTT